MMLLRQRLLALLLFVPAASAFLAVNRVLPQPAIRWTQLASSETVEESSAASSSPIMSSEKSGTEAWTKARFYNTAAFRSISLLGVLSAVGLASPVHKIPQQALAFTHVFCFASWLGTVNYTTFVLGITMFKNLPRKTFGKLQAKLFPKYFSLSSIALVLQVSSSYGMRWSHIGWVVVCTVLVVSNFLAFFFFAQMITTKVLVKVPQKPSLIALGVALGTNMLNQFFLEPLSTDNMMQRYKMEDEGADMDSPEYKVSIY